MPEVIQFKDGHQIINAYDASGKKLSSRYYTILVRSEVPIVNTLQPGQVLNLQYNMDIIDETGTFYVDNIEYGFNGCDQGLYWIDKIYNTEGYVDRIGSLGDNKYSYFRKDHLGNIREVWRPQWSYGGSTVYQATTSQRTQYYPSGLPLESYTGDNPEEQNKKYNGKEFVEMHGLDVTDLGNRGVYHAINRFTTMDRLAEKYPWQSPYVHAGNNPVNYVDMNGDSIGVAEQYKESFMNDLTKTYGDNAKDFSFNKTGMLVYNGDKSSLTKEQLEVFDGMNTLMTNETTTNVVYADSYTVGSGDNAKTFNTSEFGGALTAKGVQINGQSQNLIIISSSITNVNVSLDGMMDIITNKQANVVQNTTSGLFHEFGEVLTTNLEFRGGVIDYENKIRAIIGLPVRPYDLNHSKTIKTTYK